MERAVAIKRLRKMLGPKFGYEINPKAPTDEERAAAKEAQPRISAERRAAGEALTARMQYLLDNDAEYQQLKERAAQARKAADENTGILLTHKITVGTVNDMFFHVDAQASSWEDIFKILERRKKEPA